MAKKTKKKNQQQVKEEQAKMKREYFRKLRLAVSVMGDTSCFDHFRPSFLFCIYHLRLRPIRFKSYDCEALPLQSSVISLFDKMLTRYLQSEKIEVGLEKTKVSVYDFTVYLESFYVLWRNCEDPEHVIPFKKSDFPGYNQAYIYMREPVLAWVKLIIDYLGVISQYNSYQVWFEEEEIAPQKYALDASAFAPYYLVHIDKVEQEHITINGKTRPIYRIMYYYKGNCFKPTITPKQLGVEGLMQDFPLDVYIQQHAINRIEERLGSNGAKLVRFYINAMFYNPTVFRSDDGSFLLATAIGEFKIGYLKGDIIGNKFLVRTFLFLTNNGTPEGKKLSALLGISKEDKKYLGIDKLEMFLNSDIEQNPRLRKIFVQAGCESLFDVRQLFIQDNEAVHSVADGMVQYLLLNKEEEQEIAIVNKELAELMDVV